MVTWRCPHCRTVQAASLHCFLCGRSAISCGTCVNFRPSLVGGVGYCALDRRREPLTGAEQRPCWSGGAEAASGGLFDGAQDHPHVAVEDGLIDLTTPPTTEHRPLTGR